MQPFQQVIKIFHGPKIFHDVAVITHVVAIVVIGRAVDGIEPYSSDTQTLDVVQVFNNALEVANAITVGVFKTSGINLVDYFFFPPFILGIYSFVFVGVGWTA